MTAPVIGFIGAGNMATSLIGGLLENKVKASRLIASDPSAEQGVALERQFHVRTSTDNALTANNSDVLILAVKPQVMQAVCRALPTERKPGQLVISIAAGISCASLQQWLGEHSAIVRCMPNTPSLRGQGVSGLFANAQVSDTQREQAESIMNAVGISVWLQQEDLIDAVTAVSGSGPAYFFYLIEAMVAAGEKLGLPRDIAERLALFTALGAADMAVHSDVDVSELRRRVCSPGGTTERAIQTFSEQGLPQMVEAAMRAAAERAAEMSHELA